MFLAFLFLSLREQRVSPSCGGYADFPGAAILGAGPVLRVLSQSHRAVLDCLDRCFSASGIGPVFPLFHQDFGPMTLAYPTRTRP
jgi:hypothetical protein